MTQIMPPNYTQIPNVVFDHWMPVLGPVSFKILICLCRKIFGWHKTTDTISRNQIMRITGLSKNSVQSGIEELLSHGLILKTTNQNEYGHQPNTFSLNVYVPIDELYSDQNMGILGQNTTNGFDQKIPPLGQNMTYPLGQNMTYTKERHIKKNISFSEESLIPKPQEVMDPSKSPKDATSAEASALSEFLFSEILKRKKDFSGKLSPAWLKDASRILQVRSMDQIREIIAWCLDNSFWGPIITSTSKLRKHLDTIEMKMRSDASSSAGKDNLKKENAKFLEEVKAKCRHRDVDFGKDYFEIKHGTYYKIIFTKETLFKEQCIEILEKIGLMKNGRWQT